MDYSCGNCGKDITDVEAGVCPHCDSEFENPEKSIPWEKRSSLGNVDAFSATFMLSMTKPTSFFRRLPEKGGFFNPLIYALICGLAGTLIDLAWQLLLPSIGFIEEELQSADQSDEFYIVFALLSPLIIPLALLINTGMLHLSLLLLGVKKSNFETTFRVIGYGSGANLLVIVPLIGIIVGVIWKLALEVIGLREIYSISSRRALAAVLLPFLIPMGLLFLSVLV